MTSRTTLINIFLIFNLLHLGSSKNAPCNSRDYGNGSPVCVCNKDYCDSVDPIEPLGANEAVVYTSDKSGRRFERTIVPLQTRKSECQVDKMQCDSDFSKASIKVDSSKTFQSIQGFGGAFTDAAGINIASLPPAAQEFLLKSYFSKDGIEYTLGRVPVSSSDFSTRAYSYDDVPNDFQLEHFALAEEDIKYKIPFIQEAIKYSKGSIKLFGSSWSAPAWMKTNGRMHGNATLLGEPKPDDPYYTTFANYYVKFLQEYAKHNIPFWGLTGQNEPVNGYFPSAASPDGWQTQRFTAEMQRDFIKYNLGPALHRNGFENVTMLIMDDQRPLLPAFPRTVLTDPEARKYVSHIAVHYYSDRHTPPSVLDATHEEFPDVPMLGTEACLGTIDDVGEDHVILGSWERAEEYCRDIIEDLNHWFVGWTDWNLALNLDGGPNWAHNQVDSPIITNATAGEFYKQPMFYAMGHFSKFLPPKSFGIGLKSDITSSNVQATAFYNANGYKTIVLLNKENFATQIQISDDAKENEFLNLALPSRSITTVMWK